MFNENEDTGKLNPEEHKKEESMTTDFIMRDPEPEAEAKPEPEFQQSQISQNVPHYQEYQFQRSADQTSFERDPKPRKKRGFGKKQQLLSVVLLCLVLLQEVLW